MAFRRNIISCLFSWLFTFPNFAYAHSGNTNSQGCHNDNINGGFHCHNSDGTESSDGGGSSTGLIIAAVVIVGVSIWYLSSKRSSQYESSFLMTEEKIPTINFISTPEGASLQFRYNF